jgi:uncharacterized protein (TIGR02147 family)
MKQAALQALLRDQLSLSQAKNPAYSVRAFAKRLDIGLGTLSEVLSGKRALSLKSTLKVLDRLAVTPSERAQVLKGPKQELSYTYTQLQADHYFILSEWYYFAILSLVKTADFKSTALHVSERLGISKALAKQAIDRLIRANLLKFENKKLVRTSTAIQSTDGIPNLAIRKSHYQNLERARIALDEHPFGTFDASWLTFAFSPSDFAAAKTKIREFQDEFAEQFSTQKNASEVYRLAMQLFSLTVPRRSK